MQNLVHFNSILSGIDMLYSVGRLNHDELPQMQTKKHNYFSKALSYQKAFNKCTHWSKTQHIRAV